MNAAIYTINNGTEVAYQMKNSRVVVFKDGSRAEVKERGEWRPARGYLKPGLIEKVKAAVK